MVTSLDCKSIGFPVSKNFIVKQKKNISINLLRGIEGNSHYVYMKDLNEKDVFNKKDYIFNKKDYVLIDLCRIKRSIKIKNITYK